jgi:hypothetical protein
MGLLLQILQNPLALELAVALEVELAVALGYAHAVPRSWRWQD